MENSVNTTYLGMLASQSVQLTANGMNTALAEDGGKTKGTAKESFQKLLSEKSQNTAKPQAQGADKPQTPQDVPQESGQPEEVQEAVPAEAAVQLPTAAQMVPELVISVEEDPEEQVRRLAESGVLAAAVVPVNVEDAPVQEAPTETQTVELDVPMLEDSPVQLDAPVQQEESPLVQTQEAPQSGQEVQEQTAVRAPEEAEPEDEVQTVREAPAEKAPEMTQVSREAPKPVQEQTGGEEEPDQPEVLEADSAPKPLFHEVEAAPIKVGEAFDAQPDEAADVDAQISSQMNQAIANGQSRLEVQLTPENLGKVTIEITYSKSGVVESVLMSAERSETRELLSKHTLGLQSVLGRFGEGTVQVEVQRQEESQQGQNHSYDGHSGNQAYQQEQQNRRRHSQNSQDFLHQLRLGLIPADGE